MTEDKNQGKMDGAAAREASALRTLTTDLQASGWEVVSTAVSGEERTPIAVVCRKGGADEPIRTFVAACRSLLRAAERIRQVNPTLSAEEHETVQAARLTCRVLAERALISGATLGTFAHAEMAKAVRKQEDGEDAADAEVAAQEADLEAQRERDELEPSVEDTRDVLRDAAERAYAGPDNRTARKPFVLSGLLRVIPDEVDRREAERELDLALRPFLDEVNDPEARIRISVAAVTVLDRFRAEGRTDPAAGRVKVRAVGRGERLELEFLAETDVRFPPGPTGGGWSPTTRFSGETAWDAVVNHNSLDIVEEDGFLAFCAARGLGKDSKALELDAAFRDWEAGGGRNE